MRVTFVFACLFAAVSCLPPPPPPPPPPVFPRHSNTNRQPPSSAYRQSVAAATNRGHRTYSKPSQAINLYPAPSSSVNSKYPPPRAVKVPTAHTYQQPAANSVPVASQYPPPRAKIPTANTYQQQPRVQAPPVNDYQQQAIANSVSAASRQPAPAANSWLRPAAGPAGFAGGPGNCGYCAMRRPEPRCGINNVTYENDCYMDCEFMKKDCDGHCPCSYQHPPNSGCWCRREDHDPVCAVNPVNPAAPMKTLASSCEAACERLRVAYDGPCWGRG